MATNAIKYLSNVGKSIAYSTIDQVKEMNPAINSFKSTNADTLKSTYDAITHLNTTAKKVKDNVLDSVYGKAAIKARDNLFEDIKTGKFYNRERIEKAETEAADKFLNSDEFDFGFEFTDESSSDEEISTNDMMDLVAEKSSNAVSSAVARSAEYIVTANTQINKSLYEQNKSIFSGIHSDISTLNSNLGKLIEFASNPLQTHIQNSTVYYENSTKLDQERNEILKEMLELQRGYYKTQQTSSDGKKISSVMDIVDSEGMVDLSALASHVKKRIKEKDGGTSDMIKMMFDMGGIDSIVASPLQIVTNAIAKQLIPNILQDAMKSFNESLSGLFTSAIAKLNNTDSFNPVVSFIRDILGFEPNTKKTIDTSKYEKGPVPFDGVTRKAIVEVIPTYLSQILSAVSGREESRYNYETGKFINVRDIDRYLKSIDKDAARTAGFDVRDAMNKYVSEIRFGSKEERDKFNEDLDAILEYSYKQGMLFNSKDRSKTAKSYGLKNGEASDVNLEIIRAIYDKIPNSVKMGYATNMFREKDNQTRRMQDLEDSGTGIYTALFNESVKAVQEASQEAAAAAPGRGGIFNLLNNIYDEVKLIREYITIGRGGRRRKRGQSGPTPSPTGPSASGSGAYYDYTANADATEYSKLTKDNAYARVTEQVELADQAERLKDENLTLVDKVLFSRNVSDNFKVIYSNLDELIHKPANILGGLIKKADLAMYNFIFGDEALKNKRESEILEKGIGSYIIDQLKDQFTKFGEWAQKEVMYPVAKFVDDFFTKKLIKKIGDFFNIDTENIGKNLRQKFFGVRDEQGKYITNGLLGEGYRRFANEFKKAGRFTKDSFSGINDYFEFTTKFNDSGKAKKKYNDEVFSFLQSFNRAVDKQPKPSNKDDGVGTVENAASGMKRVTKTGIVAASEGELIIPESLNPYNVDKNKKKENEAKNKFIDTYDLGNFILGYAEGGKVDFSDYIQKVLNSGDQTKIKSVIKLIFNDKENTGRREKTEKAFENVKGEYNQYLVRDAIKSLLHDYEKEDYEEGRDKTLLGKSFDKLGEGVSSVADYIKGLVSDKDQQKKDKQAMLGTAFSELKKYAPEIGAGAVMGAGVSLLTGLFGGPIVGAALGSGISLIKNSEAVQEMVFGKEVVDAKGNKERLGGLLSKDLSNKITKYMPAIGKGAIAGAITTLLPFIPGGPVAGILVGGAAGFVSQNEEIRENLFGKDTKLGKIADSVKKALPNMGAGAIAGLIGGPFGLVTNLVVGSAIGFASSTDRFKRFMFGYDDENGVHHDGAIKNAIDTLFMPIKNFALETGKELKGWAEKYIMQPLKDAADPLRKQAELMFKGIADGVTGALNKLFEDKFGAPFDKFLKDRIFKPVANFTKNFVKGALSPFKAIVQLPFKAIGAVGDHYRTKQIQSGNADYMTASERMAFRNKKGTGILNRRFGSGESGRFTRYDKAIINLQNEEGGNETLSAIYDALNNVQNQDAAFTDVLNPAYKRFDEDIRKNAKLSYKDTKNIGKQLRKMVQGSKTPDEASEKVNKYIAKMEMDPDDKRVVQEAANQYIASFKNYQENADTRDTIKKGIYAEISDMLGVNIKEEDASKLAKLIKNELPTEKFTDKENEKAPVSEGTIKDTHEETISHIIKIEKYLEYMAKYASLNQDKVDQYMGEYEADFHEKDEKYTSRRNFINNVKTSFDETIELIKYINSVYDEAMDEGNVGWLRKVRGNKNIDFHKADQYNVDGSKKTTEARDKWSKIQKGIDPRGTGKTEPIENAAKGIKRVSKTGVVAVSEGELIVPESLNPYDVARNTVRENIAKERYYNTYGVDDIKGFAEGGTVEEDDIDTDGIRVDVMKSKIRNSTAAQKVKKAYYTFVNGKPLRFVKDRVGKLMMDTSDSETKKNYKDIQEDDEQKEGFFSTFSSITGSIGKKIKKLFGKGGDEEEEDDGENGNPIFKFLSKVVGFKGTAAKIAGAAGLAIGAPILVGVWNDHVWPALSPVLSPIVDNIKNIGSDMVEKFKDWFNNLQLDGTSTKGFSSIIEFLMKKWASGMEVIFTKVLPKTVELFISVLPSALVNLGKGIVNGLKSAINDILNIGRPSTNSDDKVKEFTIMEKGATGMDALTMTSSSTDDYMTNVVNQAFSGSSWNIGNIPGLTSSSDSGSGVEQVTSNITMTSGTTSTGPVGTAANAVSSMAEIKNGSTVYTYDPNRIYSFGDTGETLTVDQLLSYKGSLGLTAQDPETGEIIDITGENLLDYPEAAEMFGFTSRRLTQEEKKANEAALGISQGPTVGGEMAGTVASAFLRGSETPGNVISKTGRVMKKIPLMKTAGRIIDTAGKGVSAVGRLGQKILPNWMTDTPIGKAAQTKTSTKSTVFDKAVNKFYTSMSGANDTVNVLNSSTGERMTRAQAVAAGLSEEAGDFVTEKESLLSKLGKKLNINKVGAEASEEAAESATTTAGKVLKNLNTKSNDGIISSIINKITSKLSGFLKSDSIVSGIMKATKEMGQATTKEAAQKTAKELSEKLTEKFAKAFSEKIAKAGAKTISNIALTVGTAGLWKVVDAVTGFIYGWNNANNIIGVADDVQEASAITKFICGLASALNEVFAFGLVPLELLITIVIETCKLIPVLSNLVQGISEDREKSADIVAEFNEQYGLDLDVQQYNEFRENSKKNDSILRNNFIYKFFAGEKDEIDDEGNYIEGKDGAIQNVWNAVKDKAGSAWSSIKTGAGNFKNFVFGNEETGEKNIFGKSVDKLKEQMDSISNWFKPYGDSLSELGTYTASVFKDIAKYAISGEDFKSSVKIDDDDPLKGVKEGISIGAKVITFIPGQIVRVGGMIYRNILKPIGEGVVEIGTNAADIAVDMLTHAWEGDLKKAFVDSGKSDEEESDNVVVNAISGVVNGVIKIPLAIPTLLSAGLGFVVRNFDSFVDGAKEVGSGLTGTVKNMFTKAWNGNIKEAFTDSSENANTDNELVNGISKGLNNAIKVPLAIPTLLASGVGFVVRNFAGFMSGVKEVGSGLSGTVGNMLSKAWDGDISGAFTESSENANTDNELVNKISSVANNAIKVPLAIPTLISYAAGRVVSGFKSIFDTLKSAASLSSSDEKKIEDAQNGEVSIFSSDYWSNSPTESGFAGLLQNITTYFRKIANIPLALIGQILEPLSNVKNFIFGNSSTGEKNVIGKAGDAISSFGTWLDQNILGGLFTGGSSGLKAFNARGTSTNSETAKEKSDGTFISQLDHKYSNKKFNVPGDTSVQTLADTGCGPASAAMVINSFRGEDKSKMNLVSAAREAINYKAEDEGVTADYFGDTFRKHGLNTKYIMDPNQKTRSENIAASLYSNNKVVLMGQDITNTSKINSPFGPNAHYVVATGISPDGKYIYINDPESNRANIAYPSASVLRSTQMGIAANAARGSGLTPKYRKILQMYNGRGTEEIEKAVWNGLRSAGYNEIATAAAMGNIKHESGFDPSLVEKGSGVGFGLVQWSYGRRTAYEKYARSKGKSPSDLNTQIEYLIKELDANSGVWSKASSKYGFGSLTRNDWANGTNIDTATKAFMCCFERPSYKSSVNHIDRRLKASREYLQKYAGMTVTGGVSSTGSSESGSVINTILDTLNVFDDLAKGYGLISETSTTTDSTSGTTGYSATTGGTQLQNALVDKMKSIQGQLTYSQSARNPDNGSGDCSSTVQWAYKKVLNVDPGSWTGAQMDDPDTYTVTTSFDESKMQPGDLILYNGHVEMYAGNGQMIGHGGPGKGPKLKPLDDQGRFKKVRRWVGFKNASGSGLDNKYLSNKQIKDIQDINWIENNINSVEDKKSIFWDNKYDDQASLYSAGGTGGYTAPGRTFIESETINVPNTIATINSQPEASDDPSIQALVAMIKLLSKIVDNTSNLRNIVVVLGEIIDIMNQQDQLTQSQIDDQQSQILQARKENLLLTLKSSTMGGRDSGTDPALEQLVANVERLAMG